MCMGGRNNSINETVGHGDMRGMGWAVRGTGVSSEKGAKHGAASGGRLTGDRSWVASAALGCEHSKQERQGQCAS